MSIGLLVKNFYVAFGVCEFYGGMGDVFCYLRWARVPPMGDFNDDDLVCLRSSELYGKLVEDGKVRRNLPYDPEMTRPASKTHQVVSA